MMRYKRRYWILLTPLIKKCIRERFSDELAEMAVSRGKQEYRDILRRADDLGPCNPLAPYAYICYVFIAVWLGSGKRIKPIDMGLVMNDVLHLLRPLFGLINVNTKWGEKHWYRKMRAYEKWSQGKLEQYPSIWVVKFNEDLHWTGSYYYFTSCPICSFCRREGIEEILEPLSEMDRVVFAMEHGVLHRGCTIAKGDPVSDYWIVGDKVKDPH